MWGGRPSLVVTSDAIGRIRFVRGQLAASPSQPTVTELYNALETPRRPTLSPANQAASFQSSPGWMRLGIPISRARLWRGVFDTGELEIAADLGLRRQLVGDRMRIGQDYRAQPGHDDLVMPLAPAASWGERNRIVRWR